VIQHPDAGAVGEELTEPSGAGNRAAITRFGLLSGLVQPPGSGELGTASGESSGWAY
jgi:hypothetical protein